MTILFHEKMEMAEQFIERFKRENGYVGPSKKMGRWILQKYPDEVKGIWTSILSVTRWIALVNELSSTVKMKIREHCDKMSLEWIYTSAFMARKMKEPERTKHQMKMLVLALFPLLMAQDEYITNKIYKRKR